MAIAVCLAVVYLAPIIAGIGFIAALASPLLVGILTALAPITVLTVIFAVISTLLRHNNLNPLSVISATLLMGVVIGVSIFYLAPVIAGIGFITGITLALPGILAALAPIAVNIAIYATLKTAFPNKIKSFPFWNVLAIVSLMEITIATSIYLAPLIAGTGLMAFIPFPPVLVAGVLTSIIAVAVVALTCYLGHIFSHKPPPSLILYHGKKSYSQSTHPRSDEQYLIEDPVQQEDHTLISQPPGFVYWKSSP